jgi:hypothetical protein
MNTYPQHTWHVWEFACVPHRWWVNQGHRKKFLDWLGGKMQITHMEQWYDVTARQIHEHGGGHLLTYYYLNSPSMFITQTYPEFPWQIWRFFQVRNGWWAHVKWQRSYLDWFAAKIGIVDILPTDSWVKGWHQNGILGRMRKTGGKALVEHYKGDLLVMLCTAYPEREHEITTFQADNFHHQQLLHDSLRELFVAT